MAQNSEIDNVIAKCVDEIWGKYDTDGNGNLDIDWNSGSLIFVIVIGQANAICHQLTHFGKIILVH